MAILFLSDGSETLVDDDVAVQFAEADLYPHSAGYARFGSNGYLDREIMRAPKGWHVDHIDGDKRNNTRANLRVCSPTQNRWNNSKRSHNKSGFKGVYFCKQTGRWRAEIRANRRCFKLGRHPTSEAAALAYDAAARRLHGEFARLNFADGAGCGE